MKKIIVSVLLIIAFGLGVVFSNQIINKKQNNNSNNEKNNEEINDKKDNYGYYDFYEENDKLYVMNNGKKEILKDIRANNGFIYDNDRVYSRDYSDNKVYYIDMKTKKKEETGLTLKEGFYYLLDVENDDIYYAYANFDSDFDSGKKIRQTIYKYNTKTKNETIVIDKVSNADIKGGGVPSPAAVAYGDDIYVAIYDENGEHSLYRVRNGESTLIAKVGFGFARGYDPLQTFLKIMNGKLYYADTNLYSYDLKEETIKKEFEVEFNGTPIITNEKIIVVTSDNTVYIKENNQINKIKLELSEEAKNVLNDSVKDYEISEYPFESYYLLEHGKLLLTNRGYPNAIIDINSIKSDVYKITKKDLMNTNNYSVKEVYMK